MINKLRVELEPLADLLQDAGALGIAKLKELPFNEIQWKHRAYQRDSFIVAFHDALPAEFGTFVRVEGCFGQKRLVYHSDALDLDLVFRRRGSTTAFRSARTVAVPTTGDLFPDLKPVAGCGGTATRRAALIWDVPRTNEHRTMIGAMPVVTKLARPGTLLDDNDWEDGFALVPTTTTDLIPSRAKYNPDDADWDVDADEAPGPQ